MKLHPGLLLAASAAAVFAALQIWIGFWRFDIYRAGVDDGIFTQVILSTGGCFCAAAEGLNHMLVHFSPALVAGYPFLRIFGDAHGLIVLQALAIAATAFPLYGIAKRHVNDTTAGLFAVVAMAYPVLWAQTFTDFHENAFVPVLDATLAWSIVARRRRFGAAAAAALLLVKEDQTVLLAMIGVLVALVYRRDKDLRRFGVGVAAAAVAVAVLYFAAIRPWIDPGLSYGGLKFFNWTGATLANAPTVPLLSMQRVEYLFWALLPLTFLPLRSRLFLLAIPGLLEVLASRYDILLVFQTHYSMLWSGFMLAAFVDAAAEIASAGGLRARLALGVPLLASLAVLQFRDPMARWYYLYRWPGPHDAELTRVLASLPSDAAVSGTDEIYAHLATRPLARHGVEGEYFVADRQLADPTWFSRDEQILNAALKAGTYRIVRDRDGIVVARKTGKP
ncbi:MAG TPA: DUF2079 domain-containing protein [Candidatus Baltobacteraceae bacterium]|nr:DUF2079 domain-containing protein [Candidatus Baltobacteraceae bacterium]